MNSKEKALLDRIRELKAEQSGISMMDEFARYSKIERKLIKMRNELKEIASFRNEETSKAKYALNLTFYAVLGLAYLFLLSAYGFGFALMTLPDEGKWVSNPIPLFGWIISSPIFDSVSLGIPFWIFCCRSFVNFVFF